MSNPLTTEAERSRIERVRGLAARGERAIPELVALLVDPSWTVRREVVAALAAAGPRAVSALREALETARGDEAGIAAAVDALAASTAEVDAEMHVLASNTDPAIVADAAQVLGRRRNARALPLLTRLVEHPDDNVAVAAIEALGRIGGRGCVDTLIEVIGGTSFFRVFPAIDVLGRSGDPRVIAALSRLLEQPTYVLEAARALGKTGELPATAPLAALLGHGSESVARVAAVALWELKLRYQQKYGESEAPEAELERAKPNDGALRRLINGLAQSDADEQIAVGYLLGAAGGPHAVAGLKSLLDAGDRVAEVAAAGLKRLGRHADEQLAQALREGNSTRRQVLLRSVTRATAATAVLECLGDEDATVRALACDALARIGSTSAAPALFHVLADPNPRVVQAAIGAIQSLGTVETRRLALEAAAEAHSGVRWAAFRILAYFGQREALPLFLAAIDGADTKLRDAAITGLAFLEGPEALDALLVCSKDRDERTRSTAARALGSCSAHDPRVAEALLRGVHDGDAWVRYYACQSLGRLGLELATGHITPLLSDEAGQVRVAAVEALSNFRGGEALEALRRAATGRDEDVQRAALVAMGASRRSDALPILYEAAASPSASTRLVALSALAESGTPYALPVLARAMRDVDPDVRAAALGFVAGVPSVDATLLLVDQLRDGRDAERICELLATPAEGRVEGLLAALETADDDLAPSLAEALVRLRSPDARSALFKAMTLPAVAPRRAAVPAIAALRTPAGLAELKRAAESDADARVRQICQVLLAQ